MASYPLIHEYFIKSVTIKYYGKQTKVNNDFGRKISNLDTAIHGVKIFPELKF